MLPFSRAAFAAELEKLGASSVLYSYVSTDARDQVAKDGLLSGKALLTRPDLLEVAAKARGVTSAEFAKGIQDNLASWKGYSSRGPNAVFHPIPEGQVLSDKHPTKTRKLDLYQIDLGRLLADQPKTKLYGMELKKYEPDKSKPGERHHYIGEKAVAKLQDAGPEALWGRYNDVEDRGMYAPDVPHVSVHTPSGSIPAAYLTLVKKAGPAADLVDEFGRKAKAQGLNFFAVAGNKRDGASAYDAKGKNQGAMAVRNVRAAHVKWELTQGIDPHHKR